MRATVIRTVVALAALAGLGAAPAAAQLRGPIRKPELVRLLTDPFREYQEVVAIVTRRCIGFTPTARDWADLRRLGLEADLRRVMERCPPPPPPARRRGPEHPPAHSR